MLDFPAIFVFGDVARVKWLVFGGSLEGELELTVGELMI
jgi:hypothetical protein